MCYAQRLTMLREERGLSQHELARLSGISRTTITQHETGDRKPTVRSIKALARALGVHACVLDPDLVSMPGRDPDAVGTVAAEGKPHMSHCVPEDLQDIVADWHYLSADQRTSIRDYIDYVRKKNMDCDTGEKAL